MKLFKLTFMALLLGMILVAAPAKTFAQEEAEAACADAEAANLGLASAAVAAFLILPSGVIAIRRRRQQK
jgi:hypothetical protein